MNEIAIKDPYNEYPDIISYDKHNPTLYSPYADYNLSFYQTRESLQDVDTYRNFLKNAERRFRASREYKAYKAYLIEYIGIDRCQVFGNITVDDAEVELHHNVLGLLDICVLISSHILNTIGFISTFDLVQLLIQEHWANRVGITFLSKTAHQMFTTGYDSYIPPEQTFGRWWELLDRYKYGITYNIAQKIIQYNNKYAKDYQSTVRIMQNDEILGYAWANEYGEPIEQIGLEIPMIEKGDNQWNSDFQYSDQYY